MTARPDSGAGAPFTVRFWGVRGSIASPGPDTCRYGGNTACIEVRCGAARLVFDAGTGLRGLDAVLRAERQAGAGPADLDLFLTHTHMDHVCGLPFFAPAFDAECRIRLWAGHLGADESLESVLRAMMTAPLYPCPADAFGAGCAFHPFAAGDVLHPCAGVTVRTGPLNHPGGAVGYRVEFAGRSLCIITDTEHAPGQPDDAVAALVHGADAMVYDATYTDEEFPTRIGWGHSTWEEGLRVADAAGVGRAVIFHHDPARTDDELDAIGAAAGAVRPGTLVAAEGMELTL